VPNPELLEGVEDEARVVAEFFDAFDWEGTAPDPEVQSAEDFLNALD
jgi:hypothetical protein